MPLNKVIANETAVESLWLNVEIKSTMSFRDLKCGYKGFSGYEFRQHRLLKNKKDHCESG